MQSHNARLDLWVPRHRSCGGGTVFWTRVGQPRWIFVEEHLVVPGSMMSDFHVFYHVLLNYLTSFLEIDTTIDLRSQFQLIAGKVG